MAQTKIQKAVRKADTMGKLVNLFIKHASNTIEVRTELLKAYMDEMAERRLPGTPKEEIEHICRSNLGYILGFHDEETRLEVNKAYENIHPYFNLT